MDEYTPNPKADNTAYRLYIQLLNSGDVFAYNPGLLSLSSFFATMQAPTTLFLKCDEDGEPYFAFWIEPNDIGFGVISLWLRQDRRGSRASLDFVMDALAHAFGQHDTLIAYSGQEHVTKLYEHFGLARHSPDIYLGERAITMLSLTRQQFSVMRKVA